MNLALEDTARNNLASWAEVAHQRGLVSVATVSPFSTPRNATTYKQSGRQVVQRLQAAGLAVYFDPTTHALQMPNVGDLRYYADWDLWGGMVGSLGTHAERVDHVRRVFEIQDALGVPHLAPTILLHSAQSTTSQRALELAEAAVTEDPTCILSVAGDSAFWSAGLALDAHVGALAQLVPSAWVVTVVRSDALLPVRAAAEEVHGLCRSVRSFSEDGPVRVAHGDLAALPAVVAGATSVGTGWDPRQRVCAYASYAERDTGGDGGQWFVQTTFRGLVSLLKRADAQVVEAQNPALAARLVPGPVPPGPSEAFLHHATVLNDLVGGLIPGGRAAYTALLDIYADAAAEWPTVAREIGGSSQADAWFRELRRGLELFGSTEGW